LHSIQLYLNFDEPGPGGSSTGVNLLNPKRRDKLYIMAEILETAKDSVLKTQIMYRDNLSFTQLNDYLRFMLKIGLIDKVPIDGREVYKASDKGLDFLERYRQITELLKTEGKNTVAVPPADLLRSRK
jgi:predicted transcriptional regulator